jgi:hypothetical protein
MSHIAGLVALLTSVAVGLALLGCSKSPEDLEAWRPSVAKNGLDKLTEWVGDPDQPMDVRLRGAEILFEEDYAYQVDVALATTSQADQVKVAKALLPKVKGWYEADDATVENYQERKSMQFWAKEAAFRLQKYADEQDKTVYQGLLLDWISKDFLVRDQMGTVKFGQIAEELGDKAAPSLLKALADPTNNQQALASMLRGVKDDKIPGQVSTILAEMGKRQIPKLDKDLEVAVFEDEHANIVDLMVTMVDDKAMDSNLRTTAHGRIGIILKQKSLPIYLKWVRDSPGDLRWLSIQAIVENNGKAGIKPILNALPNDDKYGGDDAEAGFRTEAERLCMVDIKELSANTEPVFVEALGSGSVPAKALALHCLQHIGKASSRAKVSELLNDKSPLPAYGPTKTLGELAKETLEKLPE